MKLSWPKYLLLWLAVAAYSVQAVIGGPCMAICLGHDAPSAEIATNSECSHKAECDGARVIVSQPADDSCPCTDVSVKSEPGRVENHFKLLIKATVQSFDVLPMAIASESRTPLRLPIVHQPKYGSPPTIVRTVVLLI